MLGDSLTPEVACGFGGAFGGWLQERAGGKPVRVVLGRDGRRGSDMVRSAAVAGLLTSPILCGSTADTSLTAHPAVGATMGAVTAGANLPLVVLG